MTKSPVNECGGECQNRPRCTHFAWTEDEKDGSGTCWLKHDNKISLSDAVGTSDEKMVCGVLKKTIDRGLYLRFLFRIKTINKYRLLNLTEY